MTLKTLTIHMILKWIGWENNPKYLLLDLKRLKCISSSFFFAVSLILPLHAWVLRLLNLSSSAPLHRPTSKVKSLAFIILINSNLEQLVSSSGGFKMSSISILEDSCPKTCLLHFCFIRSPSFTGLGKCLWTRLAVRTWEVAHVSILG